MNSINLLIVDDEKRFLSTAKRLLDKRGMDTTICSNGPDALKILEECSIDVVLLDIKMPGGIDGMELLRRIRQERPDIEVILLTGHVSVESAVEGLKLGAFDYLLKPLTISEIQAKVEEAFARKQTKKEVARREEVDEGTDRPLTAGTRSTG
ncbi:MAG: response regulator [Candidatus Abyssobacteria bacterium SURF_5]|uniref:Response regulator n=1 Tax=Abyssobacteria bacterium (strain SURF_5) TaxID=2093360 RepID=A0A3A4NQC1_ABYX5|nr:MAG: response regulator [Candidatus Abyssubacteria bacterium SURF_5]